MDRYAVFGNPIAHSKSPFIHTLFARQTQQQLTYERIEAPLDGFAAAIAEFFASGERGVTSPCRLRKRPIDWCNNCLRGPNWRGR